jgi:hypothetical protein
LNTSSVTFVAGSGNGATQHAIITPSDDTLVERDENFGLDLAVGTGVATVGTQTSHSVTIIDADAQTEDPAVSVSRTGPNGVPDPVDLAKGPQPTSWTLQRSDVREIIVDLSVPITSPTADDLVLTNLGVNAPVDPNFFVPLRDDQLSLSADGLQIRISFDANQLDDGVYQLELLTAITGDAAFTFTGNASNKLHVLTGDWNGSGGVNIQDFATFAYWFGKSVPTAPNYVDSNASGGVNIQDFAGFAENFARQVIFPSGVAGVGAGSAGEGELESAMRTLLNPPDVNGDGSVTARDALNVMNEIARGTSVRLEAWSRFDTNQDGEVTSRDALFVINRLAERTELTPTGLVIQDLTREAESESRVASSEQRLPTSKTLASIGRAVVDEVRGVLTHEIDSVDASGDTQETLSLDDVIELLSCDPTR